MLRRRKDRALAVPTQARSRYRMEGYRYSPVLDPCGGRRSRLGQRRFDETLTLVAGRRFRKVLEVGCEEGRMLERLAPLCDGALGVDLSEGAVRAARKRLKDRPHLRFLAGNFLTLELPGDFDLVVCVHVITDFEPLIQRRLVERMRERLAPGGLLLCTVTDKPFALFNPAAFVRLLRSCGFQVLARRSFDTSVPKSVFGNRAILARKAKASA